MLLCDATQAIGKVRIDVEEEGIDLLCVSAHKFYGPKGAGALYVRRKNPRVSLFAQQHGGGHERGLRSGTLNVPGIVGLGKACDLARIEMWEDALRISKLRTVLEQHLCDLPNVYINGTTKHRLFNVTNLLCTGIRADELIMKCKNIAMATGSACSSANMEPSHVLRAMGLTDKEAKASIRLSLGKYTTEEEVKDVIYSLQHAITQLRSSLQ
jgi:cysteine desulfurase